MSFDFFRISLLMLCLSWALPADVHAAEPKRPNILWLIAEDFSPDLGCYGAQQVWSPNLDALAATGMRFNRAFVTAPVCSASRSAFCTGMYQTTIGAHHHRSHRDDGFVLPEGVHTAFDWMRRAGYFTANVVNFPPALDLRGTGKTDWNFTTHGELFDSRHWDDLKGHQPFYAQVNFSETHRVRGSKDGKPWPWKSPERADPAKVALPPIYPDVPIVREDWAGYLDAASALDRKVGLVLRQLEADGLADDTLVLFMSDHGQAHVRGKQFCYDDGLRIPLIIRWPKSVASPAGFHASGVSNQLISSIDLLPTCLEFAGSAKPSGMQGEIFLGAHAAPPRQYVFGARDRCDETTFRMRTVRDARWRYIRNFTPERPFLQPNAYKASSYPLWSLLGELDRQGKLTRWQHDFYLSPTMPAEELYDMDVDPWAMNNLAGSGNAESRAALVRLRAALEQWIEATGDQGRTPEPPEVAARKGATRPGSDPNAQPGKKRKSAAAGAR